MLTYEIVPDAPPGTLRAIDPEMGIDRIVFDRQKADELAAQGAPPAAPAMPMLQAPPQPSALGQRITNRVGPAAQLDIPTMGPPPDMAAAETQPIQPQTSAMPQRPLSAGAPPPPPAAPGGTVLQTAKLTPGTPGTPYDQAAEDLRNNDLADRTLEQDRRAHERQLIRNEQLLEMGKQKERDAERFAKEQANATRFQKELDTVVKKEINPDRIKDNDGLFGSLLGIVGQALGFLGGPGSTFDRMQTSLDRRVQRDIDAQKEEKESAIKNLTMKLGSSQQAEAHYRATVQATTADMLEMRLKKLGVADQYADQIQTLRDVAMQHNEQAKAASYGKPGAAEYTFGQPIPAKGTGGVGALPAGANPLITPESAEDQTLLNDALAKAHPEMNGKQRYDAWVKWAKADEDNEKSMMAANNAKQALAKFSRDGDVSGFGFLGEKMPTTLADKDSIATRQIVGNALFDYIKEQSGAAFTESEFENRKKIIIGAGDYDSMIRGVELMMQKAKSQAEANAASDAAFASARKGMLSRIRQRGAANDPNRPPPPQIGPPEAPKQAPAAKPRNPSLLSYFGLGSAE